MAWWNTAPEHPHKPGKAAAPRKTRVQARQDQDQDFKPDFPDVPAEISYLVTALFEVGPVSHIAAGPAVLTWTDLAAWRAGTGIEFKPAELRVLRKLSAEYLSQCQKSEDPMCQCPWLPQTGEHLSKVADSMRDAIRSMAS